MWMNHGSKSALRLLLVHLLVLVVPSSSDHVKPETSRFSRLPWWHTRGLFSELRDASQRRTSMLPRHAILAQRLEHMEEVIPELLQLVNGSACPKLEELFQMFLPGRWGRERLPDNLDGFFNQPYPCSNPLYLNLLLSNAYTIDERTCAIVPDPRFSSLHRSPAVQGTRDEAAGDKECMFFLPEFMRRELGVVEPVLRSRPLADLSETEQREDEVNEDELEAMIRSKLDLSSAGTSKASKRSKGRNRRKKE